MTGTLGQVPPGEGPQLVQDVGGVAKGSPSEIHSSSRPG